MRRKARLKVLYWPIFASVCIILILIGFGPMATVLRPTIEHLWAGGDFGSKLGRWLPDGARSVTLPWIDLAGTKSRNVSTRPYSAPRTLVVQNEGRGLPVTSVTLDARVDSIRSTEPRAMHSPHALRMQAAHEFSLLAEAKLFAPRRNDDEELAGIERSSIPNTRLASQSTLAEDTELDSTPEQAQTARVHIGDDIRDATKRNVEATRRGHGLGGGWPATPQLIRDLESVARVAAKKQAIRFASTAPASFSIENWQRDVTETLSLMTALPSVTSPDAGWLLTNLQSLAKTGHQVGESINDREVQIRLLRAAHAIDRRVAIWNAVWRTTQGTVTRVSDIASDSEMAAIDFSEAKQLIANVSHDASTSEDADGWMQFLMIDQLEQAAQSSDLDFRRMTAQRFLSRLTWHRLADEHHTWLDRQSIRNLTIVLRRWAAKPLDYSSLLAQIERQESDAIDLGGIDVASAVQSLRFAESREANRIADALNTYYRNANIRIAITSDLIGRMIPEVDAKVLPVRDRILGADVRGTSIANSDLSLRLIPSDHSWKLALENHGHISTGASSRQWPVLIRSDSEASFDSSTPLEITPDGAIAGSTGVDVQSATKVRNVSTEFDSIPLVSSLVREIAMNRYESMAPQAQQIQKTKIRGAVTSEVDSRVVEQLDEASGVLAKRLTGPLGTLKLSPLVVDMQTTESRLSARYRVSGDWQLAAFTPRPRAPLSSLMSVQIHQSALNNTLETILPSGEPKTINELIEQVKQLFAINESIDLAEDDEIAGTASIQFASTRPITVEIEDDMLWITMRVMRLKQDRNVDLRRFIVRAGYRPQVEGMSARLVREGHLRISGPDMSMRDRLPVRAIFNKVFATKRTLPLIPEQLAGHKSLTGLAVTQAELRDGWIAIAIGKASDIAVTPQVARSEEDEPASQAF